MFRMFRITLMILLLSFSNCYSATIPEPPKDDKTPTQVQQYLKTIYEELKRDNAESGIRLPSGSIFFMLSGSCPSGTTDVTTIYSNKFIRINSTQALTGGSDTVTIAETNLPSHTHAAGTLAADSAGAHQHNLPFGTGFGGTTRAAAADNSSGTITDGVASAGAHTHTISGATGSIGSGTAITITNPYLTCKMCQVN